MDLDLRKVRYFVAVADRLHFGRAAADLHITQPVLSRQIRALEQDIGLDLLVRDRRSVELTAAGREFLGDARAMLAAARAARHRMYRAAGGQARLTVGFGWGMAVTRVISAFTAQRPEVTVDVRHLAGEEQTGAVLDGTVDVAFVRMPVAERGIALTPLGSESLLAVLPAAHRLAGRPAVLSTDLLGERLVRRAPSGRAAAADRAEVVRGAASLLEAAPRTGSVEEILESVARGHGLTLLPRSAARFYTRPDIAYTAVLDLPPKEICLARSAADRSPLVAAFGRTAQSVGWAAAEPPAALPAPVPA
ncbi:LysR family transcriptional regulator [Actinacidiphila acidipaludis]|uniref:LysR family transcriptional regulator n=1 Tax=Actinacidiphila acidipaludis TaxID=2873382 RepID=A0ABS7Q693_9ACTN|nr:LysR substrate-binding domain-containing protein [Streptomyces acidipaludis]MBY8877274.1 LysR family transcriptional regulator [Streptomyces acidipaludis]